MVQKKSIAPIGNNIFFNKGLNYVVDENALQTGNYDLLIDYGATDDMDALAATLVTDFYVIIK